VGAQTLAFIRFGVPKFTQSGLWLAEVGVAKTSHRLLADFGDFLFIIGYKTATKLLNAFINGIIFG
jgi:hypothetical protein